MILENAPRHPYSHRVPLQTGKWHGSTGAAYGERAWWVTHPDPEVGWEGESAPTDVTKVVPSHHRPVSSHPPPQRRWGRDGTYVCPTCPIGAWDIHDAPGLRVSH